MSLKDSSPLVILTIMCYTTGIEKEGGGGGGGGEIADMINILYENTLASRYMGQ